MEFAREFGIEPTLLIAQIVNFLIILYLLKRFAYKPILTLLKKRQDEVSESLKHAEEAQKAYDRALEEEKKILKNARLEANKIMEDARNQGQKIMGEMKKEAKLLVEGQLKEARSQIAFETKEAENRLAAHVSELALRMLQKTLPEIISEKDQETFISNAVKRLKNKLD